jgi:hypothetical protein
MNAYLVKTYKKKKTERGFFVYMFHKNVFVY